MRNEYGDRSLYGPRDSGKPLAMPQQPSVSRHTARTDTRHPRIAGRADGGDLNIERGIAAAGAVLVWRHRSGYSASCRCRPGLFQPGAPPLSLCRRSLRLSISRVRLMSLASSLASRTKSLLFFIVGALAHLTLAVAVWRWLALAGFRTVGAGAVRCAVAVAVCGLVC